MGKFSTQRRVNKTIVRLTEGQYNRYGELAQTIVRIHANLLKKAREAVTVKGLLTHPIKTLGTYSEKRRKAKGWYDQTVQEASGHEPEVTTRILREFTAR